MNILQLTSHFSPNVGGVETHLDDLVNALAEKKSNITVLTYQPLTTKTKWKMFEKKNNVSIFRIPWISGFFYQLVNRPTLEFIYLFPGLFFITPFVISLKKIDVIHAHGLIAGSVSVFWGKVFNKRVIISTHSIYHFPKNGSYKSAARWMFLNADFILCLSKQSKNEIVKLGIKSRKISVFTYWVNQSVFKRKSNAKKSLKLKGTFTVLFIGRLVEEKGIKVLLETAKKIRKNICFVIAGVGPLEEKIKSESKVNKKIKFVGKITQKKLPLYYSGADILIVPSTNEEGFGRVILEALSCGLPVVAAARGGIVEAIDNTVGSLIEITPEKIIQTIQYYLSHRSILSRKAARARIYAKKYFSKKNIDVIISSYE